MCTGIAKSGNNVMFPNLVHSGVARNGKMCAQELPNVCFQIWFILELPGMARCVPKNYQKWQYCFVSRTGSFRSCQEWPKVAM